MSKITSDMLDNFPYDHYASQVIIQRGRKYFNNGHVREIDYQGDYAICQVEGNYEDYEVSLRLYAKNQIVLSCTCPHAEQVSVCKHMIASMMALNEYLKNGEVSSAWERKLDTAFENLPRRKGGGKAQRYAAIFLLRKSEYYYKTTFSLEPRIIKDSQWDVLKTVQDDPADINRALEKNNDWTKYLEHPYRRNVNPDGCLNLPLESITLL